MAKSVNKHMAPARCGQSRKKVWVSHSDVTLPTSSDCETAYARSIGTNDLLLDDDPEPQGSSMGGKTRRHTAESDGDISNPTSHQCSDAYPIAFP